MFLFSSIPMLITSFFFLLILFMVVLRSTITYKTKRSIPSKLPPGPRKLPLVGNIHQLATSSLVHRTLANLAKKHGPLMHLQLGELSIVVASSPETATEIMKTHDTIFAYRPYQLAAEILYYNSSDIIFSPYGDYWKQLRKICTMELLGPQRVQTFREIREGEVLNMITTISSEARGGGGGGINLSRMIFSMTYGITARVAFGKRSIHQDEYMAMVDILVTATGGFGITDMYPSSKFLQRVTGVRKKMEKVRKRFDKVLQAIVDEHKERGEMKEGELEEDFVDVLLRIQKHGDLQIPLTDDNLKAVIHNIFSAGSESSSTALEWAMSEMLKNPQVMKIAQEEVRAAFGTKGNVDESGLHQLTYLKLVIKETLRLHPSAPLIPRECSKDCEINGYVIPSKTKVIVNTWAIGRDPIHWAEPEMFNPDRFLNSGIDFKGPTFNYIPFGAGRRMCPGITYAIPNVELPLAQLLFHFDWKLPGRLRADEFDMTELFGITVRRKNDLYLIPIPHRCSNVIV